MNIQNIFKMAFDALRERKLRTILTILMVVVGSALLTGLNGMSGGMNEYLVGQFSTLGVNVIIVTPGSGIGQAGSSIRITDQTAFLADRIPGVVTSIPYIQQGVTIKASGSSMTATLLGINREKLSLIYPTLELEDGKIGSPSDPTILVGNTIANPANQPLGFARTGQVVTVEFASVFGDQQIMENRIFLVDGTLEYLGAAGFIPIDQTVFISTQSANSLFSKGGKYDGMYVVTENEDLVDSVSAELEDYLGDDVQIFSSETIISLIQNITGTLDLFLGSIASISLIVAGVGIFAGLYTSVMERTREVGILKALGFKRSTVISLFLGEATLIGVFGGSLGIGAGTGVAYLLTSLISGFGAGGGGPGGGGPFGPGGGNGGAAGSGGFEFSPVFSLESIVLFWVFSLAISLIAGVYPAWRASKLDPVIALRKE